MNFISNLTFIPGNLVLPPQKQEENPPSPEISHFMETPGAANFSTLFRLGIIDEDGKITPKYANIPLPRLERLFSEELNVLLNSPVTTGTNITLENLLAHLLEGTNAPAKIEIVGGFLRKLVLSNPQMIHDVLKDIMDPTQLVIPQVTTNVPDCDIRCTFIGISDEDAYQLSRRIFVYVKDDMKESFNEEKAISKKKLYHFDGHNKFGIITFKGPANLDYEILIIKELKRKSLFIHDACRLIINPLITKTKASVLLVSDFGLQPLIDLLTRIIHINNAEDIDHLGWPMLISYYTRGFTCSEKEAEGTLILKSCKFNLDKLLQHCVKNHHGNDHAAEIAFFFNASISLGSEKVLIRTLWDQVSPKETLPNEDLLWGIKKLLTEDRISFEILVNCMQFFALLHLQYPNQTVNLVKHHKENWVQIRIGNHYLLLPFNIEKALECVRDEKALHILTLLNRIWPIDFDQSGHSQIQKYRNILNVDIDRIFPHFASLFSKAQKLPFHELESGWILLLAETQDPVLCKSSYQIFSKTKARFSDEYLISFIHKLLPQDPFSAFYVFQKLETFDGNSFTKIINGFKNTSAGKIFLDTTGKETIKDCLLFALSKENPKTVKTVISLLKPFVDDPLIWNKIFNLLSESEKREIRLMAIPLIFEYGEKCDAFCWVKTLQTAAQHKSQLIYDFIDKILDKDTKEYKLFNDAVNSTQEQNKILNNLVSICLDRLPPNNTKTHHGVRIFTLRKLIFQNDDKPEVELDLRIIDILLKIGHPDGVDLVLGMITSRYEDFKGQGKIEKLITIMTKTCHLLLANEEIYEKFRIQYQYNQHLMSEEGRIYTRQFLYFLAFIKDITSDPEYKENPLATALTDKAMPLFIDFGTCDEKSYSFQMLESNKNLEKHWERFIETRLRMTLTKVEPIIHKNELTFFLDNKEKLPKNSVIRTKCVHFCMSHFCEFLLKEYHPIEDQSIILIFMEIFKEDDNNMVYLIRELINSNPHTAALSELFCSMIAVNLLILKKNKKVDDNVLNELFDQFIYMACHSPSTDAEVLLKYVKTIIQTCLKNKYCSYDRIVKWIFFHNLTAQNYLTEDIFNKHYNDAITGLFLDFQAINRIEYLQFTLRIFLIVQKFLFRTGYSKLSQGYQYYIDIFSKDPSLFQAYPGVVKGIEDAFKELKQIAKEDKKMKFYSRIITKWRAIPRNIRK